MHIRLLSLSDALSLQKLRLAADDCGTLGNKKEKSLALTIEHIQKKIQPPFKTFGAIDNLSGQLIGAAATALMPEEPDACWDLSEVIVHPDHRNRGIGRKIVMRCLQEAEISGAQEILLIVNTPNPNAIKLYESLGFAEWHTRDSAYQFNGTHFSEVSMRKVFNKQGNPAE